MRKLTGFLAVVGGLALVLMVLGGLFALVGALGKPGVPAVTVLELNLERPLGEAPPTDPVAKLMMKSTPILRDLLEAIERAAEDDRVKGLVARVGTVPMGLAQVQELRDAVIAFRRSGKFAVAWSETFGEGAAGNGAYYLATAFDEIWMLPSGDVGLTGLIYESPFVKGTLDKLGVTPRMDQRYEYKNAMNIFTETSFTAAHKEAMQRLADSQFDQIVRGIAERRGRSVEQVRALVDKGPYLGREALDAGLVDRLGYRDEVYAAAEARAGEKAEWLYPEAYLERAGRPYRKGETIALIYGIGGVARGKSRFNPVTGEATMGSDTVSAAFRAALADKKVKAIVFRVDSPGGSYVASDAIWRETVRAREKGIPVIVTMGNVAGSGGYFVAMSAEKIIAQPSTITGSIGVLGGKMLTRDMWTKVGVTFDGVKTAANADMYSSHYDYSDYGWQRHQRWLDRVYEDFTAKVARGRNLPLEEVLKIAKGRIWTGEDALKIGLVDELGGYAEALRAAREAAGLTADAAIRLKVFPRPKEIFESLLGGSPPSSEPEAALEAGVRTLRSIQPWARSLRQVGLGPHPGVLSMPPMVTAGVR
ncbi:MAG: signal peptide peptidase SppA [Acidobacteriota bacterium]|nr:signal peptide peptidase SppA [Acidobacteriota bacterium]MDQ7086573.1 signal peptide peptidase SppA [Acidobacteriota bacterium]